MVQHTYVVPAWQHVAQSANAVVEVARMRKIIIDLAKAEGRTAVEIDEEAAVGVDYSNIETHT